MVWEAYNRKIGKETVKSGGGGGGFGDGITNGRGSFMEMLPVYIKKAIHTLELIGIYILIN